MPGLTTYREQCSAHPSHYTIKMRLRNVPLEEALASKREECPVCGADTDIEEYTDE